LIDRLKEVFQVHWKVNSTHCPAGTYKTGARLAFSLSDVVLFDKTTRLIIERFRYGGSWIDGWVYVKYKGPETDPKNVGVGTYILVAREGDERKNENPITNGKVEGALKGAAQPGFRK
ncbi:hypothetical protein TELCIR_07171, partial [Teladorsagia circumcincta]